MGLCREKYIYCFDLSYICHLSQLDASREKCNINENYFRLNALCSSIMYFHFIENYFMMFMIHVIIHCSSKYLGMSLNRINMISVLTCHVKSCIFASDKSKIICGYAPVYAVISTSDSSKKK